MTERPEHLLGDPHDLVAGYLLDALDGPETARFLDHLPSCPPCRKELATLAPTIADLATAVEVQPPAALEAALLSDLFDDTRTAPDSQDGTPGEPVPPSSGAEVTTLGDTAPSRHGHAGRRRRWMWPAAAAAAFVLGIGVASTHPFAADDQPVLTATQMHQIMEITAAADAHLMPLDLPGATTTIVASSAMDKGAVLATDLPMPARGREYHLWTVMDDGTMLSAATFVPDHERRVSTMLHTGVRAATGFMLTVEEPGAPHPTTPPIAEVTT